MNIDFKRLVLLILGLSFLLKIQYVLNPNVLGAAFLYSEYLDLSVYFFDIAFLGAFLYILYYRIYIMSSIQELFHVKHNRDILIPPLLLLIFCLVSIIFSVNTILSLRQFIFFLEGVSLYFTILVLFLFHVKQNTSNVSRETNDDKNSFFYCFIYGLYGFSIFNSFIAILQFVFQRDLYLYVFGESHLGIGVHDMATITIFGHKTLRVYGLFPHPNILAAFLLLVLLTYTYFGVSRETLKNRKDCLFHVKHIFIGIVAIALILTFSKTAIILGGACLLLRASRETWLKDVYGDLFHVKHFIVYFFVIAVCLIMFFQKSFNEREYSLLEYVKTNQVSFFGNGIGTSYLKVASETHSTMNPWVLQPVHNIYLIIISELGLIGTVLMVVFLLNIFFSSKNSMFHVKQDDYQNLIVVTIILLGLGDHYFFTIPQGIFIFWMFLALETTTVLDIDKKHIS